MDSIFVIHFVACFGDAGSAIVFFAGETKEPTVVGTVSWGRGCAWKNTPDVSMKVSAFRNFIRENTGI